MGTKVYRSAEQFRRQHRRDLRRILQAGAKAYVDAHAEDAFRFAKAITPVDTGEMRSRWSEEERRMRRTLGNTDTGAAAIDHGRQRNHYSGFSRLGGSEQAPRGITRPTKERSIARDKQHKETARQAFERSV